MADEKPKHKPQQKRTLDEVLKSLQDLIRNEIVSAKPAPQSWRDSGREEKEPEPAASEPDTFNNALFKLDQIISEKIIEPVERAREEPPEPLLPDEEIEIEWDIDEGPPKEAAEPASTDIAAEDLEALDRAAASLDTIEIQVLEQPPLETIAIEEPRATPPAEPRSDLEPSLDVVAQPVEPEPIEVVEAAPVRESEEEAESIDLEPVAAAEAPAAEESIDFSLRPELIEPPEPQQIFDFRTVSPPQRTAAPDAAPPVPPPSETLTIASEPSKPRERTEISGTAGAAAQLKAPPPAELMIVDLSEDVELVPAKSKKPTSERPEAHAVELSSTGVADAFMVEFTVEPKVSQPARADTPDAKTEPGAAASGDALIYEDVKKPSESAAVKERTPPPGTEESPRKVSEREDKASAPAEPHSPSEEIPVLSEVADISAPSSAPLPDAKQARDIAIRVIARLNIERRKSGEKPLDIKTIERMQQYLADALTKRALNKLK